MYFKQLIICFTIFLHINACKINLKVRSATKSPFKFEVLMPSLDLHTERVLFKKEGQEKKVKIEGNNCVTKPWTFRTFKRNSDDEWVKAQEHTGKFDGYGEIIVQVGHDYNPRVISRSGVYCSETLICG